MNTKKTSGTKAEGNKPESKSQNRSSKSGESARASHDTKKPKGSAAGRPKMTAKK